VCIHVCMCVAGCECECECECVCVCVGEEAVQAVREGQERREK
jgi:hypothetical protein